MTSVGEGFESGVERVNRMVLERPFSVVLIFLLLTAVLAGGLPLVEIGEDMTEGFTEGLPEEQVFEDVHAEFSGPSDQGSEPTTLVHTGDNVLSQEELLNNLRVIERAEARDDLRIIEADGPASMIAKAIDPTADSAAEQYRVIEQATQEDIEIAVAELADEPQFSGYLANDFDQTTTSASGAITTLVHDFPAQQAHGQPSDEVIEGQLAVQAIADDEPGDVQAIGWGVMVEEWDQVIEDSLLLVLPVVLLLILGFLWIAYRDPIDILLALSALGIVMVATFGVLGYAGISFTLLMIAIPVLMLAIGIDLGIHVINRYREELVEGASPEPAMRTATRQLTVAFLIVTVTATIGFGANLLSEFPAIREFGIVASIGMVFTGITFAFYLPAAKAATDRIRSRFSIPHFNTTPIASETSTFGRLLGSGAVVTRKAPVLFVIIFLVIGLGAGVYATGVDSEFDHADFLPPDELPGYIENAPGPLAPSDYPATRGIALLEDRFDVGWDRVILYIEGDLEEDYALTELNRLHEDPPPTFASAEGHAFAEGILTLLQQHAEQDPEFAALVAQNDLNGNGLPDQNLEVIFDELEASNVGDQLGEYLNEDRTATQIIYTTRPGVSDSEITEDSRDLAERSEFSATPTGDPVIGGAVSDLIADSAFKSLTIALILTGIFLMVVYGGLVGRPILGLVNLLPILLTIALLLATMRYLGIPLDAITGMVLPISVGVGIDYSVHIMHRFVDEFDERATVFDAVWVSVTGTGGAAAGSMLTTATGVGALLFAMTGMLNYFGLLMALAIMYAFLTTMIVLPPALYLWARYVDGELTD